MRTHTRRVRLACSEPLDCSSQFEEARLSSTTCLQYSGNMRDDSEFNIEFCEVMEKFPCLYDSTRSDYSNRAVQDKAWAKIGEHFKVKASNCKDRWKNIRGRYVKCKNQKFLPSGSGAKRLKDYYLTPHLNFLDSFLKSRECKGNIVKETLPPKEERDAEKSVTKEGYEDNEEEESEEEFVEEAINKIETYTRSQPSQAVHPTELTRTPHRTSDDGYRKRRKGATLTDVNDQAVKYFKKEEKFLEGKKAEQYSDSIDPDMAYLQSLLPDMKAMEERKKRKFKIEVLRLADQFLNSDSSE